MKKIINVIFINMLMLCIIMPVEAKCSEQENVIPMCTEEYCEFYPKPFILDGQFGGE